MCTYLWQNFLTDSTIQNYITKKVQNIYERNQLDCIIEIWPGKWAITKKIHNISKNFFVIEKDETMKDILETMLDKNQIIFEDILSADIDKIIQNKQINPTKTLIVWNLPYYITSPIFRKLFANWEQKYFGWFFMIQNEVWNKIKTDADKKSFLWRLLNYSYNVNYCKTVWPKSFNPAPKVKSCLVEFSQKEETVDIQFTKIFEFLDLYSSFSRKTLWAINKILKKQKKHTFNVPENLNWKRLEELLWEDLKSIIKNPIQ